ncbi:MAG: hypothetical protein ACFCVD_22125 [Nodosilinea sp.]
MPKIFISYRRSDSEDIAGRIYDRLVADFDKTAIFFDVDIIPLGIDFRTLLRGEVQQCQARYWSLSLALTGSPLPMAMATAASTCLLLFSFSVRSA